MALLFLTFLHVMLAIEESKKEIVYTICNVPWCHDGKYYHVGNENELRGVLRIRTAYL